MRFASLLRSRECRHGCVVAFLIGDSFWKACGVDLLMPFIGEVAGGGVREHRRHALQKKMEALHAREDLHWYLQLRDFGYAPSAGFGLGFERLLQFFLGIENIRDAIPFARGNGKCIC